MAKVPLNNIGSAYGAIGALNDNFDTIEQGFNNTLSRDGTGPNQMEADLDMNSNDILNAGNIYTNTLSISGVEIEPTNGATIAPATVQNYQFTALGGETSYSVAPITLTTSSSVIMEVDGLVITPNLVTVSGSTISFPARTGGQKVVLRVFLRDLGGAVVPSPVGQTGKVLGSNGTALVWATDQTGGGSGGGNGISITSAPYNADNTGADDCKLALEAAFAACPDGGMIVFPAGGTYKLSTVNLSGKTVTIWADGATINCTSAGGAIVKQDHGKRLSIVGGRWIGLNNAVALNFNAITPIGNSTLDMTVERAAFQSTNAYCVLLVGCREVAFNQCTFTTTSATTAAFSGGVYCREANNPYFNQCVFQGQQKGKGFFFDGIGSPNSANPILDACVFLGWDSNVEIIGVDDFHLIGCTIDYGVSRNTYISSCDTGKILGGFLGGGIEGVSNFPAVVLTSEGGAGYAPDANRHIQIIGVNFTNHNFVGTLMDQILITGPSSTFYGSHILIQGCSFLGYTRYGINFSTIAQLTIAECQFQPAGGATEPSSSPIYNATGTGDSLVLVTNNQFPSPTTLSGANLQSTRLFNNPGYDGTNGIASIICQANGYTGLGGYGNFYWHWIDAKGPAVLDRYAGTPTARYRRASGTRAVPTAAGSADTTLSLIGSAYGLSTFNDVAGVQCATDGAQSDTSSPGRVRLLTTRSGTANSLTSTLEIDAAGNLFVNPTAQVTSGIIYFGGATVGTSSLGIHYGTGNPEGNRTATPGSLYLSTNGSTYQKATGTGNTGWSTVGGGFNTSFVHVSGCSTTCANGAVWTQVSFATEEADFLNEWTGGNAFTAFTTGIYSIQCSLALTGPTYALNEQSRVDVFKNGTRIVAGQAVAAQAATSPYNSTTSVSCTLNLTAGDVITFRVFNNASGGSASANGAAAATWATIARVK